MKTKSLITKIAKKFPKKIAETYDHPGLQVSQFKEETNCVLLCLDFDEDVLNYILDNKLENKIDLILTHHPFIFGSKKEVFDEDPIKERLYHRLEELELPIFSLHTNFDNADNGMNDLLAEKLSLLNIRKLCLDNAARGGELKHEMNVKDFANYAIEKLGVDYGLLIANGASTIKSVALVGGSGRRRYKASQLESYDIFISSDMPHHARRDVVANRYNYLDIPHEVEQAFIDFFKKMLLSFDSNMEVISVFQEKMPVVLCKQSTDKY